MDIYIYIYIYMYKMYGRRSLIRKFAVPSLVLIFFFWDIINRDDIIDTKIAELTS